MKYIKVSKVDGNEKEVTLTEVIDKTEGSGYWREGTVEEMLMNGLEVQTPFAIYKATEELKDRLERYGFHDFQIKELLNKGKIDTIHGTYVLDKEAMVLTLNGKTKEF